MRVSSSVRVTTGDPSLIREALPADLDALETLEALSFQAHRRCSRRSLKTSIASPRQIVYVIDAPASHARAEISAAATVFIYKRALRLYSVAVHPDFRSRGYGQLLINKLIEYGNRKGFARIILEADDQNDRLITWYKKLGFSVTRQLPDYYGDGESACRMVLPLRSHPAGGGKIVIVTDDQSSLELSLADAVVCSAGDYLTHERYSSCSRFHILNLCQSYKTHSMGYYVSLLASARNHRITPSVMSVKDLSSLAVAQSLLEEINSYVQEKLQVISEETFEMPILFGLTPDSRYLELSKKLYALFAVPFFNVILERKTSWKIKKISLLNVKEVASRFPDLLRTSLKRFCEKKRCARTRLKNYTYDLAILINPRESTPPSCPAALEKFRRAAEKIGFFTECITRADQRRLCEFDALFIRETTAIENHTYAMARQAYTEGLVVIDDPWSILWCSNKVYLHERLTGAGVRQPKSWLLSRESSRDPHLAALPYPLVLKLPESSFSQGVFRVGNSAELKCKLREMFAKTDLVIAQEFMVSDYDWRIGVMDNTPLFACKYYMAQGHWQVYNWHSEDGGEFSGQSETLPVSQVPEEIIKTALRATGLIGGGLYGVDIKEVNRKAYVIEVNDNPNIDAGIEDLVLGDDLYERIMRSIFTRIEAERCQPRYLT